MQEAVFHVKRLLLELAEQRRLLVYTDLHAHANKRGAFFLGNCLRGEPHAWNVALARMMALNSPHFDLDHCSFSAAGMHTADKYDPGMTKEGSGRVAIYAATGLYNAVTMEVNYATGRAVTANLPQAPGVDLPGSLFERKAPVLYDVSHWTQIGQALAVSILDLHGHNCHSVLPASQYGSLHGLISTLLKHSKNRGQEDVFVGEPCAVPPVVPETVEVCTGCIAARAPKKPEPLRTRSASNGALTRQTTNRARPSTPQASAVKARQTPRARQAAVLAPTQLHFPAGHARPPRRGRSLLPPAGRSRGAS
mmetsp:Transcript_2795/g.6632  ORF Transcript_2795/g.6632 Transcript_2795/m.6632 type:complete len:308 (+) Transcript_2795:957-1880(+)